MRPTHHFIAGVVVLAMFGLACQRNQDDGTDVVHDDRNEFRSDVIHCTSAVGKLEQCCPGFESSTLRCEFEDQTTGGGCDPDPDGYDINTHIEPALSADESDCIMHASCADLVTASVCTRAAAAAPYADTTYYGRGSGKPIPPAEHDHHDPVCP